MKRFLKVSAVILLILSAHSVSPLLWLYAKKDAPQPTNDEAAAKLKANTGDLFGFIVMGDNHAGFPYDDSATLKMARLMNREDRFKDKLPIDFVANMGDATFYTGRESNYRVYNKIRSLIKWPVITAMGNHDYVKGGWKNFKKYLGSKEFSFTDRNSYFIVLDYRISEMEEAQFAWLESELKKSAAYKHRFIFMHKPPVSLHQQSWFRPEMSPWSRHFMSLCEKYKVDIVFAGHEHMFRTRVLGGVRYIISGGGGMMTQIPDSDGGYLHYVVVRVNGDYVDYEVRKVFPPFWEFVTYYMWKEAMYALKHVFFKDGLLI
jgi:predicted phosphodiesterase